MKPTLLCLVPILLPAVTGFCQTRTWQAADGKYSFEAEFVLASAEAVYLRAPGSGAYWLTTAKFSQGDQAFIAERVRASGGVPQAAWDGIVQLAKDQYPDIPTLQRMEIESQQRAFWEIQLKLDSKEYPPGSLKQTLGFYSSPYPADYTKQLSYLSNVETKAEVAAREAKYGLGMTRRGYEALQEGTSKWEADLILDRTGDEVSSGGSTVIYQWRSGRLIISATFQGGKLVSKAQAGL